MIFQIKPYISANNAQLNTMFSEIYQMPISILDDGINSCKLAIEGEEGLSWGLEVFELLLGKEKSTLEYNGQETCDLATKEILQMLIDYKNAVNFLEKEPHRPRLSDSGNSLFR